MRSAHEVARAAWLAIALAATAGCREGTILPALGQRCSLLCATGLTCAPSGFCVKSCRCDGGAACTPTSLAEGCPEGAECLVEAAMGEGTCAARCAADGGCPPGQPLCVPGPEGRALCVVEDARLPTVDAGADR